MRARERESADDLMTDGDQQEEARTLKAEVSRLANQLRSLKQRREGVTSIERATELRLALQANARMHALTQTNHRLIMGAQASLWHMIRVSACIVMQRNGGSMAAHGVLSRP